VAPAADSPEVEARIARERVRLIRQRILSEVREERTRQQEELGYALDHDAGHNPADWVALLARYVGRAGDGGDVGDALAYRRRLVQVAAIAVAAVESLDRVT
jgi:hypothetical protein